MVGIPPPAAPVVNNDKDHSSAKPLVFGGEKFDYQKGRIKSFFLGHDVDLWDMVVDGYTHPIDNSGNKLERRVTTDQ